MADHSSQMPPDLPPAPGPGAAGIAKPKRKVGQILLLLVLLVVGAVFAAKQMGLISFDSKEEPAAEGAAAEGQAAAPPLSAIDKLLGKKPPEPTPEEMLKSKAVKTASLKPYEDPAGYFSAMFPKGYAVIDQSGETGTRVQLDYGRGVWMTLIAGDQQGRWDPAARLAQRVASIAQGTAGLPPELELTKSGLVEFGGLTGYETVLSGVVKEEPTQIHSYSLAGNGVSLQIALTCRNPNNLEKFEEVEVSIPESLRVGASSTGRGAGPAAAAKVHTEEEWALARNMLKTEGILKKGNAYAALVNGRLVREGDIVSVYSKGDKYRFVVTSILPKEVLFEPTTEGP